MSLVNIISAIGNNSSIYPLLVRDCGIEIPAKIALTYEQNVKESKPIAKLAARERFIDEYAVSAVWLGGIPLVDWLAKKGIKAAGYNSDVNMKLAKGDEFQNLAKNIESFEGKVTKSVIDDLKNVQKGVQKGSKPFEKFIAGKFAAATLIPMALMGVVLPKLIFASSSKKIEQQRAAELLLKQTNPFKDFMPLEKDKFKEFALPQPKGVFFTGVTSALANFSTVEKMATVDGGYALGRIGTARNKNERWDVGFKMAGMMFLNFVAPKYILEPVLNKMTGVYLDPTMLADKEFLNSAKNYVAGKPETMNLPKSSEAKDLFEFIDNPENAKSPFIKYADKFKKIKMLRENELSPYQKFTNWLQGKKPVQELPKYRDPREFVDVKELGKFRDSIENFAKKAVSEQSLEAFAKKAKNLKYANILTNVGLSSFLLAYCLPKAQFAFRKVITGSDLDPGLAGEAEKKGVSV